VNIRPLHDRVVVKREPEERKSPGGIVIPGAIRQIQRDWSQSWQRGARRHAWGRRHGCGRTAV